MENLKNIKLLFVKLLDKTLSVRQSTHLEVVDLFVTDAALMGQLRGCDSMVIVNLVGL